MATINIRMVGYLLIVTISGELSSDEVIAVVNEYYSKGIKDVIWDLTGGSLRKMTKDDFIAIATATKKAVELGARKDGRTVYVGSNELENDLLRMYANIAEMTGVTAKYDVFRTIDEVRDWIM